MTVKLTAEQITAWRERRFHRRPDLALRTEDDAVRFVDEVGFCSLFPDEYAPMPNLWEAINGSERPLPDHHNDYALDLTWTWKDSLPERKCFYYGKVVRKKPTLISLRLLPHFYALSENYGDPYEYLQQYRDGRLSDEARRIYEALLEGGAMPTSQLRREALLAGKTNMSRFDRAIRELQADFKIAKVGISDANAWGYCYVYDLFTRRFPEVVEQAQRISGREAMQTILRQYLENVLAVEEQVLVHLFGWEQSYLEATVNRLVQDGYLIRGVRVEGTARECVALAEGWP
ncbi:MAG: winged helix DNA-binding domain-containing protein [Chloroflexi bacterium]|nr:winged helix DNA-binding domain-containing protein [Chloroflexota bacterium]